MLVFYCELEKKKVKAQLLCSIQAVALLESKMNTNYFSTPAFTMHVLWICLDKGLLLVLATSTQVTLFIEMYYIYVSCINRGKQRDGKQHATNISQPDINLGCCS